MQEGLFGKYETAERCKCNELKYFSSANIYMKQICRPIKSYHSSRNIHVCIKQSCEPIKSCRIQLIPIFEEVLVHVFMAYM